MVLKCFISGMVSSSMISFVPFQVCDTDGGYSPPEKHMKAHNYMILFQEKLEQFNFSLLLNLRTLAIL